MHSSADKTQENKSQSVANRKAQVQGSGASTFQFVDNRPEAIKERKLKNSIDSSIQISTSKILPTVMSSPPHQGVIQSKGSGGEKIGFHLIKSEDPNEHLKAGIQLLLLSWSEAREQRKLKKTEWMDQNIKGDKFSGSGSATTTYATELDKMPEEKEMLLDLDAFKEKKLTYEEKSGAIWYKYGEAEENKIQIATLKLGNEAYVETGLEKTKRQVFHKHGLETTKTSEGNAKEYIEDSLNVKTRRYAYVEKNYYQMMDFFKTGKMTGRFQQNMKAGGGTEDSSTMTEGVKNKVISGSKKKGQKLTNIQIAVAHQEMGSSPEQRGVSLTTTEKVGATVGNAGENFRTEDGFRLKIDLARVPKEILLINHFAQGGIIDKDLSKSSVKKVTTDTDPQSKNPYKYGGSVRKNRELYIDRVEADWVVEIEHHTKGGYGEKPEKSVKLDETNTFDKAATPYEDYWKGFDAVLKNTSTDDLTSEAAKKGIGSAKLVKEGYDAGKVIKPPVSALKAHEEVANPKLKDKYSQYHIGYIRGRVGKELFKDSDNYAQEMK